MTPTVSYYTYMSLRLSILPRIKVVKEIDSGCIKKTRESERR